MTRPNYIEPMTSSAVCQCGVAAVDRSLNTMKLKQSTCGPRAAKVRSIALSLLLSASILSGCSSVKPELSAEDRAFNEQLKQNSSYREPSPTEDMSLGQKALRYVLGPILYAVGSAQGFNASFSP